MNIDDIEWLCEKAKQEITVIQEREGVFRLGNEEGDWISYLGDVRKGILMDAMHTIIDEKEFHIVPTPTGYVIYDNLDMLIESFHNEDKTKALENCLIWKKNNT